VEIYILDQNNISRSALKFLIQDRIPSASVFEVHSLEELPGGNRERTPGLLLLSWDSLQKNVKSEAWIKTAKDNNPSLKIIALSGRPEVSFSTLQAGADAFVCKCDSPERLLAAIERALDNPR
jgi:DNA-binding NarL/FixJ family response regulator